MAQGQDREHTEVPAQSTGRAVVQGTHGVVCAGHQLTSMAAMRVLLNGGNAFDAAAAAGFAAAVIEPTASFTLAGEGVGMFYHAASGEVRAVSGQGVSPRAATLAYFRERGLDEIPTGPGEHAHLSFTVPGIVDALLTLLETYGTKSLGEILAPVIDYAQHGFPMYEYMHRMLDSPETPAQFNRYPPGGTDIFYPNGKRLDVDRLLKQPQLGQTLALMVAAERAGSGGRRAGIQAARRMFYEGEIAQRIVAYSERVGGLLHHTDLANYHAAIEAPVTTTFAGYEICTQSVWSQAPILLQALNILEQVGLRALGHNSPAYIHTVVEAMKLAFADREHYYGDPDFSSIPIDALLSKDYAAQRRRLIKDQATPALPAPGVLSGLPEQDWPAQTSTPTQASAPSAREEGTTHFAIIDREENMVCITPSGGVFRRSAFVPELGCTLSTRSEMFCLHESHPNRLEPGKRPRTTLVNYMVCRDGVPVMTFGCPGGDDQAQANLQTMVNVVVFGMDAQQAVEAPRFSTQSARNSFYPHTYTPGQLNLEHPIPADVAADLSARGHKIERTGACGVGAVVTQRDPSSGVLIAGADPRRPTYAIAW